MRVQLIERSLEELNTLMGHVCNLLTELDDELDDLRFGSGNINWDE
jgi:hypothetical protein